ncbi:hypothetical protein AArc1_0005 [Natrarchaeobaculum sulfurireducens]|uniref:Uncharacterized protein n=1 Tax=Natrarchaeobaculum sulfurireducens TaxID=2044521 RepID=A0A346PA15_9EURY|nr:hypothetical protein AArc1_0005 [Natrarchaeobaculum sulfurireducens]
MWLILRALRERADNCVSLVAGFYGSILETSSVRHIVDNSSRENPTRLRLGFIITGGVTTP